MICSFRTTMNLIMFTHLYFSASVASQNFFATMSLFVCFYCMHTLLHTSPYEAAGFASQVFPTKNRFYSNLIFIMGIHLLEKNCFYMKIMLSLWVWQWFEEVHSNQPIPDSKVHGANMGPTWGRQDPGGPHVDPMNFAIWDIKQKKNSW